MMEALERAAGFLGTPIPIGTITGVEIATTWLEILAFITGVWCVWLAARRHVLNFPIGIVNVSLFVVLFAGVGLYADMALQFVYIGLGFAGWYWWLRGGPQRSELAIRHAGRAHTAVMAIALVATTVAIYALLTSHTDSTVPGLDAATTGLSLVAQYMLSRKLLQNWYVWIAADLIYIPLYAYKGLYLTAGLYVVFLALCVYGLAQWRGQMPGAIKADAADRIDAPSPAVLTKVES